MLVDQAELNDHGVILEYQLGNTSRRRHAMLTDHSNVTLAAPSSTPSEEPGSLA